MAFYCFYTVLNLNDCLLALLGIMAKHVFIENCITSVQLENKISITNITI